eukprot:g963.t1
MPGDEEQMKESGQDDPMKEPGNITDEKVESLSSFSGCDKDLCRQYLEKASGNYELASLKIYAQRQQRQRDEARREKAAQQEAVQVAIRQQLRPARSLYWVSVREAVVAPLSATALVRHAFHGLYQTAMSSLAHGQVELTLAAALLAGGRAEVRYVACFAPAVARDWVHCLLRAHACATGTAGALQDGADATTKCLAESLLRVVDTSHAEPGLRETTDARHCIACLRRAMATAAGNGSCNHDLGETCVCRRIQRVLCECTVTLGADELRRVLRPAEFELYLTATLEQLIDLDPRLTRCANEECAMPIELADPTSDGEPETAIAAADKASFSAPGGSDRDTALTHYSRFRIRCPRCDTVFCARCGCKGYHPGYDCDAWRRRGQERACVFCDSPLRDPKSTEAGAPETRPRAASLFEEDMFALRLDGKHTYLELEPLPLLDGAGTGSGAELGLDWAAQYLDEECPWGDDDSDDDADGLRPSPRARARTEMPSVSNLADLPTEALTVEAWIRPDERHRGSTHGVVAAMGGAGGEPGFELALHNGQLRATISRLRNEEDDAGFAAVARAGERLLTGYWPLDKGGDAAGEPLAGSNAGRAVCHLWDEPCATMYSEIKKHLDWALMQNEALPLLGAVEDDEDCDRRELVQGWQAGQSLLTTSHIQQLEGKRRERAQRQQRFKERKAKAADMLQPMGFPPDIAIDALKAHNDDVEQVGRQLVNG